ATETHGEKNTSRFSHRAIRNESCDLAAETGPTGGEVACRARSSRGTALSGVDDKSLPPAFAAREESGVASRVPGTRSRILCWSRPQSNSSKTAKGFLPCGLAV